MFELKASNPNGLEEVARALIDRAGEQKVWAISGKMGAGKTTLIQAIVKCMGSNDDVTSPTFALVNEYLDGSGQPIYHFDLYRLEDVGEVFDIGFTEYLESEAYCLIEWPAMVQDLLPANFVQVTIEETGGQRLYRLSRAQESLGGTAL